MSRSHISPALSLLLQFMAIVLLSSFGQAQDSYQEDLRQLARAGDPEAQFALAQTLDIPGASNPESAEALAWYEASAAQQLPVACLYLGMRYEFGNGVPLDKTKAMTLYRSAGLGGLATAQFLLGNIFLEQKELVNANAWLTLAARQGYPDAMEPLEQTRRELQDAGQGGQAERVIAVLVKDMEARAKAKHPLPITK